MRLQKDVKSTKHYTMFTNERMYTVLSFNIFAIPNFNGYVAIGPHNFTHSTCKRALFCP